VEDGNAGRTRRRHGRVRRLARECQAKLENYQKAEGGVDFIPLSLFSQFPLNLLDRPLVIYADSLSSLSCRRDEWSSDKSRQPSSDISFFGTSQSRRCSRSILRIYRKRTSSETGELQSILTLQS